MTDYWKSTPKFWCKFCEAFFPDTKLEKARHEQSERHQNRVKAFVRNVHRKKADEERTAKEVQKIIGGTTTPTIKQSLKRAHNPTTNIFGKKLKGVDASASAVKISDYGIAGIDIPEQNYSTSPSAAADIGSWQVVATYEDKAEQQVTAPASRPVHDVHDDPDNLLDYKVSTKAHDTRDEVDDAPVAAFKKRKSTSKNIRQPLK